MDSWSKTTSQGTVGRGTDEWNTLMQKSPLAAADWSSYFEGQVPSQGWWTQVQPPFAYGPSGNLGESFDYDPGGTGSPYGPTSGLTMQMINSDIDQWLMREHPELFDFTSDWQSGGVAGVGQVGKNLNGAKFGQFQDWQDQEILAAAQKHGVPVNFMKAIIHRESQGMASELRLHPLRGEWLVPYTGIFRSAARSWGFSDAQFYESAENHALAVDIMGRGLRYWYDELQRRNPQYGWLQVAATWYSGDPTGATTPSDSYQYGTTREYVRDIENWWKGLDADAQNTWSNFTSTGQGTGVASPNVREWGPVNQYDDIVAAAAQKYGVPANLIKAVMRLESDGNPNAQHQESGATGLMQVMPFHVGGDASVLFDPATNIDVGTRILMDNYRRWGSWENAAKAYLAGNPNSTAVDANGTGVDAYWRKVNAFWNELRADGSGVYGGPTSPDAGPMLQLDSIWGGMDVNITQPFANPSGNGLYEYGASMGLNGSQHTGLDVGMPRGTMLYTPVGGVVEYAGPDQGFKTYVGDRGDAAGAIWRPDSGAVIIRLDNGHQIIFGHNDKTLVQAGQRVTPGMAVAQSGAMFGAHLHLEYRVPSESGGWRLVDPTQALSGVFSGTHQGAKTGLGYTQPLTFQNLMRAGASGAPIPSGSIYSFGGGRSAWNTWLRQAMSGQAPMSGYKALDYNYISQFSPSRGVFAGTPLGASGSGVDTP